MSNTPEIDLHGQFPDEALRTLARELHAARMRGATAIRVITGRGWGNRRQEPILRTRVEEWLRGHEGKRYGFKGYERVARGGALLVRLAPRSKPEEEQ